MLSLLKVGASGLDAQGLNQQTIANNLANVNTPAYKSRRLDFQAGLYQRLEQTDLPVNPQGRLQVGRGIVPAASMIDLARGAVVETGRELDLAIAGEGFFGLALPDGTTGLTRDGTFRLDAGGRVVHAASGYPLQPALEVPANYQSLQIDPAGQVGVVLNDGTRQAAGNLQLYRPVVPEVLEPLGQGVFRVPAEQLRSGTAGQGGLGQIRQGFQEQSNVDLAEEMTRMITALRAYQLAARVVQTGDEMWGLANELRR